MGVGNWDREKASFSGVLRCINDPSSMPVTMVNESLCDMNKLLHRISDFLDLVIFVFFLPACVHFSLFLTVANPSLQVSLICCIV